MRTEATGYGAIFFVQNMLQQIKQDVEGKSVLISGSGNVATHAAEKVLQLGGKPLTLSDSGGFIECSDGLTQEQIDWIKELKDVRNLTILMAEQNFNQAIKIADRGYVIVHGKIEFEGESAAELQDNEMIKQYYLGV